ncbi:MAG: DNA translocase FtsK, partial [Caldilineaceae bacterium]|nr:DNA translocase FtsK [Caldilineaceae bacterium]
MPRSSRRSSVRYTGRRTLAQWWAELSENFSIELLGLFLFLGAGGLLLTLLRGGATSPYGVPWLVQMTGWTAPWVAVSAMGIGALLMLHEQLERLGRYWSAEAIVGAELLFLSLQVGTFLWHVESVNWAPRYDGLDGGMVGWAIGTLLLAALGRWPGFAVMVILGAIGLYYTVRYTPLIYLLPLASHFIAGRTDGRANSQRRSTQPANADAPSREKASATVTAFGHWLQSGAQTVGRWSRAAVAHLLLLVPTAEPHGRSPQAVAVPSEAANFVTPERRRRDNTHVPPDEPRVRLVHPHADSVPSRADASATPPTRRAATSTKTTAASVPPVPPVHSEQPTAAPKKRRSKKATTTSAPPPLPTGLVPSIELLNADQGVYEAVNVQHIQELIENTLEDFNVPVKVVHVESGPTVTQFGVAPLYLERGGQRRKVRVNRIVSLADDLALALAVPAVRIEAPVPGRPYVGIEVPNTEKATVSLRGVIESPAFQKDGGRLPLPLGRNTAGAGVVMDLTCAPHMLIAGSTGSGKSVCINTIITGLLMRYGPESLRFVMVDPKMVELPGYNGIPHMIGKVITEMDQVMGALTWLLLEMDDRYQSFKAVGVRNVETYNALAGKKPKKGEEPITPLPYIVLVIDELADLMMTAADDIERQLCRLAQMARATGIHLIIATQRPSTDVVTGLIKANFPTRI